MSYIYNTVTGKLSGGTPELRYANSTQTIEHILLGSIGESVVSYKASISLDWTLGTGHTLIETVDVDVTPNAAYPDGTAYDIVANFDTYMSAFSNAVNGRVGGVSLVYTLRGFDVDNKEQTYAVFEITGIQSPAAPGSPAPSDTRPETTINGLYGAVRLIDSAGANLPTSGNSIPITKATVGLSNVQNILDNLNATAAPTATADSAAGYAVGSRWIDVTHAKSYTCVDATANAAIWTEGGVTLAGLYPDRNPVAQVPVLDATLGVCHYLDATFTEIAFAYPVWHLVEIRALVRSVNAAITGTVEITPYIDDVAQDAVAIEVGATWAAVVIPLEVETGSIRLVRTGGTLADGDWVTAAFRGITAIVTI